MRWWYFRRRGGARGARIERRRSAKEGVAPIRGARGARDQGGESGLLRYGVLHLFGLIMDESASGSVRTRVVLRERSANFRLVLWMSQNWSQFLATVSELALDRVAAGSAFFPASA